ncbi:MAG: VWA domain-containing protein [gamma proteobacterium symbiont of Lucinoma myriamae]|nr:VWA domain-containing protein [gamma proteobacterium symbiont of Lucinoma myriamae]
MLDAFHFIRPEWFITLPFIALLLVLLLKRSKKNNSGWEAVCDPELLAFQLAQQSGNKNRPEKIPFQLLHWTVPFLFLIATIALAGPSWEKKEQPVFQQGNALIIILDLSLSMNAKDIKPSRLERAKLKLIDILKQKKEGQTALIAFAGDAHTVSPLTIDNKTIMSLLPALDSAIMPLSGSHLIDALNTAKQLFKNAGFAQGDILLITDGIDPSQQSKLEKNITTLRKQGYHFSIIGVGSQTGSPIPRPQKGGFVKDQSGQIVLIKLSPEPLKTLVKLGNGNYHKLSLDDSDFKAIIEHNLRIDKQAIEQDDHLEQWVDAGAYLTLVLIPFALLSFRKGLLSIMLIIFLAPYLIMEPAYADENTDQQWIGQFNQKLSNGWDKLWSTPNQKGQKAFNSQNYQQAAESFTNKNWKAGAQYRAGEFAQALQQYSQSDDAMSLYNKGNTLANMEKFQDAADAYEQAIKKQPEFENASKNLDYMKEIIAQQKKQQQEQKSSDKNQDQSDKQSENQQQEQQNSTDDASKGNESDSKDSEKNSSDESDAQKEENESDEAESNEPKSPEDYQQKNAKQDESDKDAELQAQTEPVAEEETENKDEDEQPGSEDTPSDVLSQLNQEEQQSLKQWLQRIPDNPGKLLKVKFRNNTLLKQRQADTEAQYEGDPW